MLAAAVTCMTLSAGTAMGQKNVDGNIVSRSMGEPLTLFDWGLAQLDRDMARTAARLLPGRADEPNCFPPHGGSKNTGNVTPDRESSIFNPFSDFRIYPRP